MLCHFFGTAAVPDYSRAQKMLMHRKPQGLFLVHNLSAGCVLCARLCVLVCVYVCLCVYLYVIGDIRVNSGSIFIT